MKFPIGAMSVGDILDRGLKLLLARLPLFYGLQLIVLGPLLILQMILTLEADQLGQYVTAIPFLVVLFALILQPIGTAAILHVIEKEYVNEPTNFGDAFSFAFKRFAPLLGTSIMVGLVIVLGFLMCGVPGILFSVWYIFAAQVVVVEGLSGGPAMTRSKTLTEGYRWRIFGLVCLIAVVSFILGLGAGTIAQLLPTHTAVPGPNGLPVLTTNVPNALIGVLVQFLLNALVGTYQAVCMTLLYFDTRVRKEGFDLELAARAEATAL